MNINGAQVVESQGFIAVDGAVEPSPAQASPPQISDFLELAQLISFDEVSCSAVKFEHALYLRVIRVINPKGGLLFITSG